MTPSSSPPQPLVISATAKYSSNKGGGSTSVYSSIEKLLGSSKDFADCNHNQEKDAESNSKGELSNSLVFFAIGV